MTVQPLSLPDVTRPAAIAAARVRELQNLIAEAQTRISASPRLTGQVSASSPPSPSGGFAAALADASAQSASAQPPAPSGPSGADAYDSLVQSAAARYNLDPSLLHGLIEQESGFDPGSRSSAGALGLTQLMPETAASLGIADPLDPAQSVDGGARYLSGLLGEFHGNVIDALAAYNAGPGAVHRYGGVPPYAETQSYVSKVIGYADAYRRASAAAGPAGVTG